MPEPPCATPTCAVHPDPPLRHAGFPKDWRSRKAKEAKATWESMAAEILELRFFVTKSLKSKSLPTIAAPRMLICEADFHVQAAFFHFWLTKKPLTGVGSRPLVCKSKAFSWRECLNLLLATRPFPWWTSRCFALCALEVSQIPVPYGPWTCYWFF